MSNFLLPSDPTLDPSSPPPILTNLPAAETAFTKKYANSDFQTYLAQLSAPIRQSFIDYDTQRVQRGQNPLSADQSLAALKSSLSNQAATPPPSEGFFGRLVGDVQSLVSSVPQLPFQLASEVQQLPDAPSKLSDALGAGGPAEVLKGLTQVPGVRMVPGVNTLSTLFNEGPGGLLQHPLLTALDVLPYAAPAAGALSETVLSKLPAVQAARDSLDMGALNTARADAGLPALNDPSAARLTARTSPIVQAFANGPLGQTFSKLFGTNARDLAQMNYSTINRYQQMVNPESPIAITPDVQILRDAKQAAQQWADIIPEARRTELTNAMQLDRNTVLNDPSLTDAERGFVTENIYHNDQLANYGVRLAATSPNGLGQVDGEIYTAQEAARIQSSRANVARYQSLSDARNLIAQSSPATADSTLSAIDTANIASEHLSRNDQLTLARSYAYALDGAGIDATPLLDVVKQARNDRTIPIQDVKAAFDTHLSDPPTAPTTLTTSDIIAQLQPYMGRISNGDPLVAQVRTLIDNGDYQAAVEKLRTINSRSTFVIPNSDTMLDSLVRARDRQKFIDQTSRFNDRNLSLVQKSNAALESRIAPARFTPLIEQGVQSRLEDMYSSDPAALQLIHDHLYTQLQDLGATELNKLYRDVSKTWQDMKDQGYDPVFVHRVSPSSVPSIDKITLTDTLRTPDSIKARTFDATPYVHDASVAVTDQAMQYLRRLASEEYINHVQTLYGVSGEDLQARYLPLAQQAAEAQPGLDVAAHLQNLMQRSHTQFNPTSIFSGKGSISNISGPSDVWVPKAVDGVLKQMFHDYNTSTISHIFDPIMRTFRTALIPLSPRSFMHHFVGAGVMLAAESDPSIFFRQLSAARDLVNSGEFGTIKGMPPSGLGDAPADIVSWGKTATKSDRIVAGQQLAAGKWIRENIWDRTSPVRDAAGNAIDNIYRFRTHMDDMYRGMAYLEGRDKALTAGMTADQAEQAGIGLVRKTMQSWDRMTPMERQTIRMVFPFYGYMSHVLKYAFRYPMDHPFRVGVLDNFARNESNDFGTSLPSQLMDSLFLGNPDAKGNVSSVQLQSFNPFRDVANYFTLAGFTGASNPVIQGVLKAMGVDPRKGAPSLYPDIAYDPVTGQLRPDNPNLLSSFATDVIPQLQIVTALTGHNDQFKQILKQNPDAAAAMLRGAAGLPNIFKTINPAQEAFKSEVQRESLQNTVKQNALKTGDWSQAQQFPQLRAYFQQVAQLMGSNPAIFQQYMPSSTGASTPTPSTADALKRAFVGLNTP